MRAYFADPLRDRHRLNWLLVFGLGVGVRLVLWSGYGLIDDPNYFNCYFNIFKQGTYDPTDPYAMRFGLWVPIVAMMHLLGPTEAGFIGAVTLCSIVNLVLVYLLARQEWERPYALVAMLLLAVCPLDVLCSGLFANDVILTTYAFAALWLYRRSMREDLGLPSQLASAAGAGLFLFFGFVTKPWVILYAPVFLGEALIRGRWRRASSVALCGVAAVLVSGFLAWQWHRFGDPLHHINVARSFAVFEPYDRRVLLSYPRMLLQQNEYGSYFAGYYPHVLLALAVILVGRTRAAGKWLLYSALVLAGLVLLPGGRTDGVLGVIPRIFRYLAMLSIPLSLALAAYWRQMFRRRWEPAVVGLAFFVLLSIVQAAAVTEPTRDVFGEQRRSIALLRAFPDEVVWADWNWGHRFVAFELRMQAFQRFRGVPGETPKKRAEEFAKIQEGIVVTGGARTPWYNCFECLGNLDDFAVPPSWRLETTLAGRPAPYRREPLRIWHVRAARGQAQALHAERPDWPGRRALLRELLDRGDDVLAIEVGELLLAKAPPAARGDIAAEIGFACYREGRWTCAVQHLTDALPFSTDAHRRREVLETLVRIEAKRFDFPKAQQWIAEIRRRFPTAPLDPQLGEIETGMAEGIARYGRGEYEAARAVFVSLAEGREGIRDDVRHQARYWLAMTLFRLDRVEDGLVVAQAYRDEYGEDPSSLELRFRHAEALATRDPRAARELFTELVERHPGTLWANEAQRRLDTQPPEPAE